MVLCGTKNGSSMASLKKPFEAPLFLSGLYIIKLLKRFRSACSHMFLNKFVKWLKVVVSFK